MSLSGGRARRERTFVGGECAVCDELLEHTLDRERVLQLRCGHVAHEACLYEYIKDDDESQYCPTCASPLGLDPFKGGPIIDLRRLGELVRTVADGNPHSNLRRGSFHSTSERFELSRRPKTHHIVSRARSSTALGAGSVTADTFKDSGYGSYGSSNPGPSEKHREGETMTIATDNQSLNIPESTKEQLVVALVEELLDSIIMEGNRAALVTTQIEEICSVLKECSLEMGHCANSKVEQDTVTFIRQQRRRIARLIEKHWNHRDQEPESETETDDEVMSVGEKMRLWRTDEQLSAESAMEESMTADFADLGDEPPIPQLPHARAFLTTHPSYPRLIFRLRAILEDQVCEGYRTTNIRHTILQHLTSPPLRGTAARSARFKFPAPSRSFLANNALFQDGESLLHAAIVAGGLDNAFATTCMEYVTMAWGQDGVTIFNKMQEALHSEIQASWLSLGEPGKATRISFAVATDVSGDESRQKYLLALATGSPVVMAELGEQLAWISSAFLELEDSKALMIRKPTVLVEMNEEGCDIAFLIESQDVRTLDETPSMPKPRCWHRLLRGFNLVEGFPIRPRKTTQKGLEIPLDMLAFIAETPRATIFDDRMVLKGWATSLTPTARVEDSLLWHYLLEGKGGPLSYDAITRSCPKTSQSILGLGWSCLSSGRHFLGWCDTSRVVAGTSAATYDKMDWSGAEFCPAGVAFEKTSIIGGEFLTGGATFVKGTGNTPLISAAPRQYKEQIEWLSGKNVVFYDVGERRAWLIDGALAVFHLMRTRLSFRPYSSSTECKPEKLRHADSSYGPDAGYNALTDTVNMHLEVFRDEHPWEEKIETAIGPSAIERRTKITITRFADLVTNTWYIFEEMFAHQSRLQTASGVNLRFTTRDKLEGYDFKDVAKGESPLRPRFVTLKPSGKGWVDFVRSIGAISLFGSGFGDIIVPAGQVEGLCQHWRQVPHGQDYLATSVSMIKEIRRRNASRQPGPFQVAQGIYWHQHDKLFGACHCKPHKWKDSCDRIQTLLPVSVGKKRSPDILNPIYQNGAVIFGRGKRCPYRWPRDPAKEPEERRTGDDSDVADEDPAVMAEDSGLGSSISADASRGFSSDSASLSASLPAKELPRVPPRATREASEESLDSDPARTELRGLGSTNSDGVDNTVPSSPGLNAIIGVSGSIGVTPSTLVTHSGLVAATKSSGRTIDLTALKQSRSRLVLRAKRLISPSVNTHGRAGTRRTATPQTVSSGPQG